MGQSFHRPYLYQLVPLPINRTIVDSLILKVDPPFLSCLGPPDIRGAQGREHVDKTLRFSDFYLNSC